MKDPDRTVKFAGLDDSVGDTVNAPPTFAPHHCEECGRKAKEYWRIQYMTVCGDCLRPADRARLDRKIARRAMLDRRKCNKVCDNGSPKEV